MTPSKKDLRLLFQRSGNRCAFPTCTKTLVYPATSLDGLVALSEVAHIVAQKPDGPRGDYPLPLDQRDAYDNLILLCEEHHHIVDAQKYTYTVERLRQMKMDHEGLVEGAAGRAVESRASEAAITHVRETLHSTLLPVLRMPRYVYSVLCDYNDSQEREASKQILPPNNGEMYPFIIRNGKLFCFQNLRHEGSPFRKFVKGRKIERYESREWWDDPDHLAWFISLLNRSLNKLTGRRGLNLDKRHKRYYFQSKEPGRPLEVAYRPMNQRFGNRHAVWQPVSKRTGQPRAYWYHRAVALDFLRVGTEEWCLSLRPEMHVTKDGENPLRSDKIGSRVTHKKSRMFNYDLLKEVHFWRDYLSDSKPRIVLPFDEKQSVVVSTTMMQAEIEWPGIPEEYAKPFRNVEYEEDLFSIPSLSYLDVEDEEDWDDEEGWEDGLVHEP